MCFIKTLYEEVKISSDKKNTDLMRKIANDIIKAINIYFERLNLPNPTIDYDWEYNLIEDKQVNAFCAPGGKIAVYTGMLKIHKK